MKTQNVNCIKDFIPLIFQSSFFTLFLTTYLRSWTLFMYIGNKGGKKWKILDHLPTFCCPRCFLMTEPFMKITIFQELKHYDEFTDEEKKAIVEKCTINLIGPRRLSKKYKTMTYVVRRIVEDAGLKCTPDDLPDDYPKKSEDQTNEEYQVGCRNIKLYISVH